MKRFQYGLTFRIVNYLSIFVMLATNIIIIYSLGYITLRLINASDFVNQDFIINGLCVSWGIGLFLLLWVFALGIAALTSYPSIEVNHDGFRISTVVSQSKWLSWDAINKIHQPIFYQRLHMMGVKGLGALYILNGLFYWLGSGGFLISQAIENYQELIALLKQKRPDLFI